MSLKLPSDALDDLTKTFTRDREYCDALMTFRTEIQSRKYLFTISGQGITFHTSRLACCQSRKSAFLNRAEKPPKRIRLSW